MKLTIRGDDRRTPRHAHHTMHEHSPALRQRSVNEVGSLGNVHEDVLVLVVIDGDDQVVGPGRRAVGADGDDVSEAESCSVASVQVG